MAAAADVIEVDGAVVLVAGTVMPPCVQRFRDASIARLKAERLADRAEQVELTRVEKMLSEHSAGGDGAQRAASTWRVMGGSGRGASAGSFIETPGGLCTTLTYDEDTATIKKAME